MFRAAGDIEAHAPAESFLSTQDSVGEALADNDYGRFAGVIGLGESPTLQDSHAQDPKIVRTNDQRRNGREVLRVRRGSL